MLTSERVMCRGVKYDRVRHDSWMHTLWVMRDSNVRPLVPVPHLPTSAFYNLKHLINQIVSKYGKLDKGIAPYVRP